MPFGKKRRNISFSSLTFIDIFIHAMFNNFYMYILASCLFFSHEHFLLFLQKRCYSLAMKNSIQTYLLHLLTIGLVFNIL